MPETIVLKGNGIRKEMRSGDVITPGQLLGVVASGDNHIGVHETFNAVQPMFAVENELTGDGIDVEYLLEDYVHYEILPPGAEVYAFLAPGAPVVVTGNFLESDLTGYLRKVETPPSPITIGVALENIDNSSGSEPVRIKVEVM